MAATATLTQQSSRHDSLDVRRQSSEKQGPNHAARRLSQSVDTATSFPGIQPFPSNVPTAPLLRISLSRLLANDPEENTRLWQACCDLGFFYIDLRLPSDRRQDVPVDGEELLRDVEKLFLVQKEFFKLDDEEKAKYDFADQDSYYGYKGLGAGIIDKKGTTDRNEFYNTSKDDILGLSEPLPKPTMLENQRPLFKSFIQNSHSLVTLILTILNDRLTLPRAKLASLHRLDVPSGDQVRFVRAPSQPIDDSRVALGEHSDFGSVTVLFNRLGGLQVRLPQGIDAIEGSSDSSVADGPDRSRLCEIDPSTGERWTYVKPLPGHAIVNLGDAMVKFTAGLLRSNVHRVVSPPGPQDRATRYSLVYFSRPEDDVLLKPLSMVGSEMIDERIARRPELRDEEAMTSKEWVLRRALQRRKGGDFAKSGGTEGPRS